MSLRARTSKCLASSNYLVGVCRVDESQERLNRQTRVHAAYKDFRSMREMAVGRTGVWPATMSDGTRAWQVITHAPAYGRAKSSRGRGPAMERKIR